MNLLSATVGHVRKFFGWLGMNSFLRCLQSLVVIFNVACWAFLNVVHEIGIPRTFECYTSAMASKQASRDAIAIVTACVAGIEDAVTDEMLENDEHIREIITSLARWLWGSLIISSHPTGTTPEKILQELAKEFV